MKTLASLLGVTLLLSNCTYILTGGANYGRVDENLTRSGQLTKKRFHKIQEKYQPASIINLRGENTGRDWYETEKQLCQENNLPLYNLKLRASRLPKREEVLESISLIEDVEFPSHAHCKAGADRTGLFATLYLHVKRGLPIEQAVKKGCRITHANIIPYQRRFFAQYLNFSKHNPDVSFRKWVETHYEGPTTE